MTTLPPEPPIRRRLSRRMPWQLPMASLLMLCTVMLVVWQPLRARGDEGPQKAEDPVAELPQQVITPAASETSNYEIEATPIGEDEAFIEIPQGDPLADPTVGDSRLEESDQINILLLGTDGRDEEDGPPRTDLMMLMMLDSASQRATVISIPRDLWVPIPAYGEGKINTAYFLGSLEDEGVELAQQTVEELVGRPVHHVVQVDFAGFRTIVDQMGGIEIAVPDEIDDPLYPDGNYGTLHLKIPAGRQRMDGETALRYARTRYGGLDQDRSARQQLVMLAIREQALEPAQLARAPLFLRTLYRTVESDLSLGDLFALARIARTLDREQISMHTLNGDLTWSAITWNGQDALLYDPDALRAAIDGWIEGEE